MSTQLCIPRPAALRPAEPAVPAATLGSRSYSGFLLPPGSSVTADLYCRRYPAVTGDFCSRRDPAVTANLCCRRYPTVIADLYCRQDDKMQLQRIFTTHAPLQGNAGVLVHRLQHDRCLNCKTDKFNTKAQELLQMS